MATISGCLWVLAVLVGLGSCFDIRESFQANFRSETNTLEMHRRVKRAVSQPCPGTTAGASVNVEHTEEVEKLIDAMKTAEFRDLPGVIANEKRSYTYDCTLGKGKSAAVVIRAKVKVGDAAERTTVLKVAFDDKAGKSKEEIAKSKTDLKKEAELMTTAHHVAELTDFVPKPGPHGPSKTQAYYYMEMAEVGSTLDALLVKQDGTTGGEWKENFEKIMVMVRTLHNRNDLSKCFIHGDVHLGNVARHKDDASKLYLIDWGRAKRCTLPEMPVTVANIDPSAMFDSIIYELLQFALVLAGCACDKVFDWVKMYDEPIVCHYGNGKANAKAYPRYAAAKFASLESYATKTKDWITMQQLQTKLTGLVKDPDYKLQ